MNFRLPIPRIASRAFAIVALAPLATPGAVFAQSQEQWNSLHDRIVRLEEIVRGMQGDARDRGADAVRNDPRSAARLDLRIGNLEEQMRRLLASMERLNRDARRNGRDADARSPRPEEAVREGRSRVEPKTRVRDENGTDAPSPADSGALSLALLPDANEVTVPAEGAEVYDREGLNALVGEDSILGGDPVSDGWTNDPTPGPIALGAITSRPDGSVGAAADAAAPGSNASTGSSGPAPGPTALGTITLRPNASTGDGNAAAPLSDVVEKRTLDGERVASLAADDGPEFVYEQAYDNVLGGRFDAAEAGFELFLSRYENHELAPKARYWLGEAHYAREDYANAARVFLDGYRSHKKSRMAPVNLVKLGMSLHNMGQKEQACATFGQLNSEFPDAEAERKLAGRESRRAGC